MTPEGASCAESVSSESHAEGQAARSGVADCCALFEAAGCGLAQVDPASGRFLRVNRKFCQQTGRSAEELTGLTFQAITHPDDLTPDSEQMPRLLAGEVDDYATRKRYLRPDGTAIWVQTTISLLRDKAGRPWRLVGVIQEIGDLKQAELTLAAQARRRELLLDATREMILAGSKRADLARAVFDKVSGHLNADVCFNYRLDPQGCGALQLVTGFGIPPELWEASQHLELGQAFCGTVAATRAPLVADAVRIAQDPKGSFVRGMGVRAYACHPLFARDGRVLGTLSLASTRRDDFDREEVSFLQTLCHYVAMAWERIEAEEALRQSEGRLRQQNEYLASANAALAEADRRKNEFLAMLAHELRNPLAPVRNAVQVMKMAGSQEPLLMRQREIIDRQVAHMAHLVDDLLDVSRITQGRIELKKRVLNLQEVLNQAVETIMPLVEKAHQALTPALAPEAIRVEADPDRILQIVGNLLANANKYTPEGGQIRLEAWREGETAVIRVRDSGVGIPQEILPKIFDLFAQADQGLARSKGGLGIGLTMVKRLAEMHGGAVEAHSAGPGLGSEFVVRLPALAEEETGKKMAGARRKGNGEVCPEKPSRVLVVDDVADSAESLAELLGIWGYTAQVATDGVSALKAAEAFRPDVALLDIGMPGMDGYEVARRLRDEHGQEMRLVALTGYGTEEDRRRAREAGFDRHLVKPVDLGVLQQFLECGEWA